MDEATSAGSVTPQPPYILSRCAPGELGCLDHTRRWLEIKLELLGAW